MKLPLVKLELGSRLTKEDVEFLNELIPELFPDRDLTEENAFTGREVIMAMAEAAVLKLRKANQSKPEDLQRINELTEENKRLSGDAHDFNHLAVLRGDEISELINQSKQYQHEIAEQKEAINDLEEKLSGISTEHNQVKERTLTLEKYVPEPNEMRIIIDPLTAKVLALYAEKVARRNKTDVRPGEILCSLFNRYITRRETELPGFPFMITRQEIAELAKQIDNE